MGNFSEEMRESAIQWIEDTILETHVARPITNETIMAVLADNYLGGFEGFMDDFHAGRKS